MYCLSPHVLYGGDKESRVYVGVCVIIHLYEPVRGLNPEALKIRDGSWWALVSLTSLTSLTFRQFALYNSYSNIHTVQKFGTFLYQYMLLMSI